MAVFAVLKQIREVHTCIASASPCVSDCIDWHCVTSLVLCYKLFPCACECIHWHCVTSFVLFMTLGGLRSVFDVVGGAEQVSALATSHIRVADYVRRNIVQ